MVVQREGIHTLLKGQPKERKDMRILYTNIVGFSSKRLECMDHQERDKPHIMCILRVETNLRPNIQVDWFGDGNYGLWRRDSEEGWRWYDCVDKKGLDSEEREPLRFFFPAL